MIHSFLMIGQSNMAGRGFKGEVEPIKNSRIKVLRIVTEALQKAVDENLKRGLD